MKTRDTAWFDSLGKRDFENQAVLNEIRSVFKERDELRKRVQQGSGQPEWLSQALNEGDGTYRP